MHRYLITASLAIVSPLARAATHHVDAANGTPGDGTTWKKSFATLQDALRVAQAGEAVLVAAGVYYPDEGSGQVDNAVGSSFVIRARVEVLGGYPTQGGVRDPKANFCVLSGDLRQDDNDPEQNGITEVPSRRQGDNALHIVTMAGNGSVLDGFTVTGGAAIQAGTDSHGGALYAESVQITVRQCAFVGNFCTGRGGRCISAGRRAIF